MTTPAEGSGAIAKGSQFAIELAKGLFSFFPNSLGGVKVGGEPIDHLPGIGHLAVAAALVIFGELFNGIEAGVVPFDGTEIGGEGVPIILGYACCAVDIAEAKHGPTKELVLAVGTLADGFGNEEFFVTRICKVGLRDGIKAVSYTHLDAADE